MMPSHDAFEPRDLVAPHTQISDADFAERWEALHTRAQAIAHMAALAAEPFSGEIADFPQAAAQASKPSRELVMRGAEDIDAILQPGFTALLTIQARGQDVTSAALALWREFYNARKAVLVLCRSEQEALEDN